MRPLKALAESASELRVPLSLVLKSDLGREVLRTTSSVAGLVLQGGGAVHHVFGSPRFSADLDFAQQPDLDEEPPLGGRRLQCTGAPRVARLGRRFREGSQKPRLHRQKLRVALDAGTSHVLAIERYEVPVHEPEIRTAVGGAEPVRVESPAEIIADKVVAALDRFSARGMTKLRDVFDVAFLLDLGRPGRDLVLAKLADYGYPRDLAPLAGIAASLDEVAAERLRSELRDVLPRPYLERFDPLQAVRKVRALYEELSR
jgi:hypothetical protein